MTKVVLTQGVSQKPKVQKAGVALPVSLINPVPRCSPFCEFSLPAKQKWSLQAMLPDLCRASVFPEIISADLTIPEIFLSGSIRVTLCIANPACCRAKFPELLWEKLNRSLPVEVVAAPP